MNWTIERLASPDYFCVSFSGTYSRAGARSAAQEIAARSDFTNGDSLLLDDTEMDMGKINAADIDELSVMLGDFDEKIGSSMIAVVGCTDLQFGLARQFQIKSESNSSANVKAFRYALPAVEWLSCRRAPRDPSIDVSVLLFPATART